MKNLSARRRLAMRLAFISATVVAVACGGDSSTTATASTNPVGDYALFTVNGKPIPFRVYSDTGYTLDITTSSLSLKSDGTFIAASRIEERVDAHLSVYADTGKGTWSQTGTLLTFVNSDNSKQGAQFVSGNITLVDSSGVSLLTYVYAKK